ncbi:MAG: hypothetical protein LRZ84_15370 [Desertifilum sp.]|nr:hypothetical protein [Oscillatoria laete-virens]MCD8488073.1 hypothetical protein [Desertifilum sp.]MDL5052357.1 hypothetical protein [Oscillatoria laete-virens NRMC-F 0139]
MRKPLLALVTTAGLGLLSLTLSPAALAQRVIEVSPDLNSQNVPPSSAISGQFDAAGGSAIDPNSVRILVNGQDVTNRSTITRNFFSYRPDQPLPPGQNRVQIEFRNTAGQNLAVGWNFTVQQPQAALEINSITHNAANNPLGPGSNFLATVNGTPGSQVSILMVQDGRTIRELRAQEVAAGVYVATLNVQASDRINEGIIIGRLQRQNQTTYAAAPQSAIFTTTATGNVAPQLGGTGTGAVSVQPELQPIFTSHNDGETITGRGFTLSGQGQPNATLDINVVARVRVLGGVISAGNETLIDQSVRTDANGNFTLRVPPPAILSSGTSYVVTATTRGTTDAPTQITLYQR